MFHYLLLQYVALAGSVTGCRQILYPSVQFNIENLDDNEAIFKFRFSKGQILAILPYLRLDLIQWSNRYHPDSLTSLCILLRRLAYPERWGSMTRDFGRSRSYLCSVARDVVLHLVD
ncbi:hypothetical protein POJ06DRAFT_100917 [Lipomyces tetrasporus]|uniref:Uncharacterized protein n=1 Tax=Lipomyces tetrasporus TaxID=54092 RepID=A0AAD7QRM0_9ASCO|nr:uncharacterized protein POJ06DRAFT_100917 [Lipomyces tetrasporus]KAJ8100287.1 hypothetical protein POJ06DRAFT_100917 [Lipomyces tetrasporus]